MRSEGGAGLAIQAEAARCGLRDELRLALSNRQRPHILTAVGTRMVRGRSETPTRRTYGVHLDLAHLRHGGRSHRQA